MQGHVGRRRVIVRNQTVRTSKITTEGQVTLDDDWRLGIAMPTVKRGVNVERLEVMDSSMHECCHGNLRCLIVRRLRAFRLLRPLIVILQLARLHVYEHTRIGLIVNLCHGRRHGRALNQLFGAN